MFLAARTAADPDQFVDAVRGSLARLTQGSRSIT